MRKIPITDVQGITAQFDLGGQYISANRFGRGHINDTYLVTVNKNDGDGRFIIQRINHHVFRDPPALMENVLRITQHLESKSDANRICLSLVATNDGEYCFRDPDACYWRAYRFVDAACTYDAVSNRGQAWEAAAEFALFQKMISDLPGPRLHETIPDFHNTRARYQQFHDASTSDSHDRARHCNAEIEWVLAHEQIAGSLHALQQAGDIPERITHNDTKLNNVLFDEQSGEALCVIDLDTVMPGMVLHDFGDLVRTATMTAAEDETDLSKVGIRMDYFEALAEGYLSVAADFLTEVEIDNLALAGKVITIETGVRFLTDYLSGDSYFRINRPAQNLDRCRAQFALAESIGEQLNAMQEAVAEIASIMAGRKRAGSS